MSAQAADLQRVLVECQSARAVSSLPPPSLPEEEGSIAAQLLNCQITITQKTSRSQATFSFYLNSTLSRCATKFFASAKRYVSNSSLLPVAAAGGEDVFAATPIVRHMSSRRSIIVVEVFLPLLVTTRILRLGMGFLCLVEGFRLCPAVPVFIPPGMSPAPWAELRRPQAPQPDNELANRTS